MDAALKAKWVEKLRSGEIQQARGRLKDFDGSMCCLGVLREIAEPGCTERSGDSEYLPERIADSAQIRWIEQNKLSKLNDGSTYELVKQHSFAEIADYIEANL